MSDYNKDTKSSSKDLRRQYDGAYSPKPVSRRSANENREANNVKRRSPAPSVGSSDGYNARRYTSDSHTNAHSTVVRRENSTAGRTVNRTSGQPRAIRSAEDTGSQSRPLDGARALERRGVTRNRPNSSSRDRLGNRIQAPNRRVSASRRNNSNSKRRAPNKQSGMAKVVSIITSIALGTVGFIATIFKGANRFLDRFRTNEVKRIVVNCLLCGLLALALLSGYMLIKPSIDASRAVAYAKKGDVAQALKFLSQAESEGLSSNKASRARLEMAEAFANAGSYSAARQMISETDADEKSREVSKRIDYAEAESMYKSGDRAKASQLYYRLGSYLDSDDKYKNCLCILAVQAYLDGSEAKARSLLAEIEDAETRMGTAFNALGRNDLSNNPLFSAESLKQMRESYAELKQNSVSAKKGLIAVGANHSLLVKVDGEVLATGDGSNGQCDVYGWNDIIMVAAGKNHSVGLKADGSVVACGDNSQGQTEVSAWRDITAIAAGAYTTIGLKSDGSVVVCGMGTDKAEGWRGIASISGGGYSYGALGSDGFMRSSHLSALLPPDIKLFEVSVCGGVSAGILYDGSLISSYPSAPEWSNLKLVTVSETGIFAVTRGGEIKSLYFRKGDDLNISVNGAVSEIAVSSGHAIALMEDGRVIGFGDNTFGQTSVSGWRR